MKHTRDTRKKGFHLTKWFLDFTGEDGSVLICYAARLTWKGITVPYTHVLWQRPGEPTTQKTRYTRARMPVQDGRQLIWGDPGCQVAGIWETSVDPLEARLFESGQGHLDWHCLHPRSRVTLEFEGGQYIGEGYAEVLHMTIPAWEMPMRELRWGHFLSPGHWGVWIEIKEEAGPRQWVWWDGKPEAGCRISDSEIYIPGANGSLHLNRGRVLEADKKILQIVGKLVRYLPGFRKVIPESFLMADAHKWYSQARMDMGPKETFTGRAIHEFVNFNPAADGA
ncbi:MAG: hypothetical protein ACO20F_13185 [Robiginitalea sp.]|jgi:hypothetical protein